MCHAARKFQRRKSAKLVASLYSSKYTVFTYAVEVTANAWKICETNLCLLQVFDVECYSTVTVNIHITSYGNEIRWSIDGGQTTTYSSSHRSHVHPVVLPTDGHHIFTYMDTYGDGWHGGYWEIVDACGGTIGGGAVNGQVNGNGGEFDFAGEAQCCSTSQAKHDVECCAAASNAKCLNDYRMTMSSSVCSSEGAFLFNCTVPEGTLLGTGEYSLGGCFGPTPFCLANNGCSR
jgi:hypothetical protein